MTRAFRMKPKRHRAKTIDGRRISTKSKSGTGRGAAAHFLCIAHEVGESQILRAIKPAIRRG
jgi:hypothetical protein